MVLGIIVDGDALIAPIVVDLSTKQLQYNPTSKESYVLSYRNMTEHGIVTHRMGGLGNQMFIVAAGYVISETIHVPLYIPYCAPDKNPHNKKQHDYLQTIFKAFHHKQYIPQDQYLTYVLSKWRYKVHAPPGFSKWVPDEFEPGTILCSYYQYYPPLAKFENQLRSMFVEGLELQRQTITQRFGDLTTYAFLHIRRGDYVNLPHIHYNQTVDYYQRARDKYFSMISTLPTKIMVLSDDVEWVRAQPFFNTTPHFQIVDGLDELETLALMTLCKAGAMIGNSTFSWWGAFLGCYESRTPVLYPKRWIAEQIESLFPEEWICVE